jgi:hypothetical protein
MAGWYDEAADSGHDPAIVAARERGQFRLSTVLGDAPEFDAEAVKHRLIVTDPAESIAAINRKLQEAPYTHLVFGGGNTTPSGMRAERMYPYLERFAKEVIPAFR